MIQFKTIDGLLLRDMVMAGTAILEKNREAVDALNVFPVPDGDTGTNMSLTMQSATREINSKEFLRADEAANALAKGALKGARGNSGVITSQLLRGFAKALNGVEKITPVQFAEALMKGSEMAYKAVMKPKEGTILTVARVVAEDAQVGLHLAQLLHDVVGERVVVVDHRDHWAPPFPRRASISERSVRAEPSSATPRAIAPALLTVSRYSLSGTES